MDEKELNDKRQTQKETEDSLAEMYAYVALQIKRGFSKMDIFRQLIDKGIEESFAEETVDSLYASLKETAAKEHRAGSSVLLALIGAGIAAVVGGLVWGGIVIATGYEIGFMATGIGLLTGWAVVKFSRGSKGLFLQVIAIIFSVIGIVIGKYIAFFPAAQAYFAEEIGVQTAANMHLFSKTIIDYFREAIGAMLGILDVLWIILAVLAAWRIPKGSSIRISQK